VDTGLRKENASKQKTRASVLIQSEPMLWRPMRARFHDPDIEGAIRAAVL
jgi:methylglyoxal synthase